MVFRSCLMIALVATAVGAEAATLVENGKVRATIVVGAQAGSQEKQAADELRVYVEKITGVALPVVTDAVPVAGPRVLVGRSRLTEAQAAKVTLQDPGPRGYLLEADGRDIRILGADAEGTLNGVYTLLDRLGVRWYMPGPFGEVVPQRKTLRVASFQERYAPPFRSVYGLAWAGYGPAQEWVRRNRAEGGVGQHFGHNWSNLIASSEVEKHPEYFALVEGKRKPPQLCTTNPDVIRLSAEKAARYFREHPGSKMFSLSPDDGYGFCECDRCKALDGELGAKPGILTDRFVAYWNAVAEQVVKEFPDHQLGFLAYINYTEPPTRIRLHRNLVPMICHTPWEFCHAHAVTDAACEKNPAFRRMLEGWRRLSDHVYVYDYYGHFYAFGPWPLVHAMRKDIPYFRAAGVDGFCSETQQNWGTQGLNFYVAARLLWNPEQDVDRLLSDFYRDFYGPAAAPMRRYWERWEQAMASTAAQNCGGYKWWAIFTPERLAGAEANLQEAARRVSADTPEAARLRFAGQGFEFTKRWARMNELGNKGDYAGAVAAGQEAVAYAESVKDSPIYVVETWLAVPQTKNQIQEWQKKLDAKKP